MATSEAVVLEVNEPVDVSIVFGAFELDASEAVDLSELAEVIVLDDTDIPIDEIIVEAMEVLATSADVAIEFELVEATGVEGLELGLPVGTLVMAAVGVEELSSLDEVITTELNPPELLAEASMVVATILVDRVPNVDKLEVADEDMDEAAEVESEVPGPGVETLVAATELPEILDGEAIDSVDWLTDDVAVLEAEDVTVEVIDLETVDKSVETIVDSGIGLSVPVILIVGDENAEVD